MKRFLFLVDGLDTVIYLFNYRIFVQGYFLLRFLASQIGEQQFLAFLRSFVKRYHGHLVLSQVGLRKKNPAFRWVK